MDILVILPQLLWLRGMVPTDGEMEILHFFRDGKFDSPFLLCDAKSRFKPNFGDTKVYAKKCSATLDSELAIAKFLEKAINDFIGKHGWEYEFFVLCKNDEMVVKIAELVNCRKCLCFISLDEHGDESNYRNVELWNDEQHTCNFFTEHLATYEVNNSNGRSICGSSRAASPTNGAP